MPAPSATSGGRVKVSVVVPVYNPGRYIDDCIASLLRQSLPLDEYEAIFVDDGSTDGTGERLDALAAEHPHITSLHIPNSGWPGRPRNVGMDASTGKYVLFVDNDDWLADEALERLYDRADRNGADVVVGKEVGHGKGVPRHLFRRNVDDAKLLHTPLLDILTPHKLFRRAFLDEHRIRFPEGRRRLEDHVFVMKAFFNAGRISVLADYPCYHWIKREDATNATDNYADPKGYYENVREILDIVDAYTDAGPERDRFYAHWYRSKGLHRMRGAGWAGTWTPHVRTIYNEVRQLAVERCGPGVARALPTKFRVLARSVSEGRRELIRAQAGLERGLKAEPTLTGVSWADGRLGLRLVATLTYADGSPIRLERRQDRLVWAPPPPLGGDPAIRDADLDVTDEAPQTSLAVVLRHRATFTEHDVVATVVDEHHQHDERTISRSVSVEIDPAVFAVGDALAIGVWDIFVHFTSCGWGAIHRLACSPSLLGTVEPAPMGETKRTAVPYVTEPGNLSLRVARVRAATRSMPVVTAPRPTTQPPGVPVIAQPPPVRGNQDAGAPAASTDVLIAALRRLLEREWAEGSNARAREAFEAARRAALDVAADSARELPLALRVLARAALADRLDLARSSVRLMRGLRADARRDDARTVPGARDEAIRIAIVYADGSSVALRRAGSRVYWDAPRTLSDAGLTDDDLDITDELPRTRVTVEGSADAQTGPPAIANVAAYDAGVFTMRAVVPRAAAESAGARLVLETCGWRLVAPTRGTRGAARRATDTPSAGGLLRRGARRARGVARRALRAFDGG